MNKALLEINDCRKCYYNEVCWCWYTGQPREIDTEVIEDFEEDILYPIPDWCPLLNKNEHSKSND